MKINIDALFLIMIPFIIKVVPQINKLLLKNLVLNYYQNYLNDK